MNVQVVFDTFVSGTSVDESIFELWLQGWTLLEVEALQYAEMRVFLGDNDVVNGGKGGGNRHGTSTDAAFAAAATAAASQHSGRGNNRFGPAGAKASLAASPSSSGGGGGGGVGGGVGGGDGSAGIERAKAEVRLRSAVHSDVRDQFRLFALLEQYLMKPRFMLAHCVRPLPPSVIRRLVAAYCR
jgi:hypothetical protein